MYVYSYTYIYIRNGIRNPGREPDRRPRSRPWDVRWAAAETPKGPGTRSAISTPGKYHKKNHVNFHLDLDLKLNAVETRPAISTPPAFAVKSAIVQSRQLALT